jgi:hypothetical protein
MVNRVMAAKARKLRSQKRRYPRRMDLDKRGPRPNKEMLAEYRNRGKGVDDGIPNRFANTPPGKHDIEQRREQILRRHDPVLRTKYKDNPVLAIWVCFDSAQREVWIEETRKRTQTIRNSIVYACTADAYFVLKNECVTWAE